MVSDGAEAFFANKVEAELFSRAQHAGSLGPAHQLAKRLDLSRYGLMLDVAGGSGAFSITFCERSDDLRATVLDFENVVDVARLYVIEAGMSDRIDFIVGSALDVRWPEEVDLVLMSYLLSAVPGRHHQQLLNSAWSALAPGGDLVVHDFMLDPNQSGPLAASQWFFAYLPTVPGAVSFSDLRLVDLARSAGFVNVSSEDFIPGLTRIVVARKPGEESG
jgi:ubiquinone/menaquinone biosynthesis C-methylase UbiE